MKRAAALVRTDKAPINLDSVEVDEEPKAEECAIRFEGRRISVDPDTKILPLHMVRVRPTK